MILSLFEHNGNKNSISFHPVRYQIIKISLVLTDRFVDHESCNTLNDVLFVLQGELI